MGSKKLGQKQAESVRTTVEIVRSAEPGPDGRSGVRIHYAQKASTDDSEPHTITGFVHGSPAAKLNKDRPDLIRIGQQLHEVDGKSLAGLSIEEVRSLILGEPGSRYVQPKLARHCLLEFCSRRVASYLTSYLERLSVSK